VYCEMCAVVLGIPHQVFEPAAVFAQMALFDTVTLTWLVMYSGSHTIFSLMHPVCLLLW
jgi:hypothetical protein